MGFIELQNRRPKPQSVQDPNGQQQTEAAMVT